MATWVVQIEASFSDTVEVEAEDENEAMELAQWAWTHSSRSLPSSGGIDKHAPFHYNRRHDGETSNAHPRDAGRRSMDGT
jgi:hypothetical protein